MYISKAEITKKLYELMSSSISYNFRDPNHLHQRTWIVAIGLLWLCSCQYFPKSEVPIDAEDTKSYQGRIAFKNPDHSFVTLFHWLESNSHFQLTLRDRLALGGIRLQGTESIAQVEYSNGQKEEDVDLDQWIEDKIGIAVPFKELWKCLSLKCKLIDEADQEKYDQFGRLEMFSSNQWSFTLSYRDVEPDSLILSKLEMHNDATEIRIFFSKFEN